MAKPLLPFARKGLPGPYMITPGTDNEAASGQATLIACGDIDIIVRGIKRVAPDRTDLVDKFEALRPT